jgi:hypothetical protein
METLINSFDTLLGGIDFCPVAQDKLTFDSPLYKQLLQLFERYLHTREQGESVDLSEENSACCLWL